MMRLSAIESMVDICSRKAVSAALASPPAMAFCTFLMALRSLVRRPALTVRCLVDCLARLAACLELAMRMLFGVGDWKGKPDIIHHLSIQNKALGIKG